MKINTYDLRSKRLFEADRIHVAHQENMLVFEFASFILWEFKSSEASSINKVEHSIDWLVIWFSLIRDVFTLNKVYLERVQFVSEERT